MTKSLGSKEGKANMIDRLFFHRRKNNSYYCEKWKNEEITLNVNGEKLQGWFIKAPTYSEAPIVFYYGGNAEDVSVQLSYLDPPLSMSFLILNYRGFGESTGCPTQKNLFSDALKIFDLILKEHKATAEQICLVGRSIGASIAAYVASQRNVKKLVLVTPFDAIANVFSASSWLFPLKKALGRYFNTAQYLEHVNAKILVISASNDEVVPRKCLENLIEKFPDEIALVEIQGADHQNISDYPEYEAAIESYISE
jgi:uncharacterized protein